MIGTRKSRLINWRAELLESLYAMLWSLIEDGALIYLNLCRNRIVLSWSTFA